MINVHFIFKFSGQVCLFKTEKDTVLVQSLHAGLSSESGKGRHSQVIISVSFGGGKRRLAIDLSFSIRLTLFCLSLCYFEKFFSLQ